MTQYTGTNNLENETILPTRIWAGGNALNNNRRTLYFNDSIQPLGNNTTVSAEDLHIKCFQLGQHQPSLVSDPGAGTNRLYLGTLDFRNTTVDIHNRVGLLANKFSTATETTINLANVDAANELATAITNNPTARSGRIFDVSDGIIATWNSNSTMTATATDGIVTIVTDGNTNLTAVSPLPTEWEEIRLYTDTSASVNFSPAVIVPRRGSGSSIIGGSNGTSMRWTDVNFIGTGRRYSYIGNEHARRIGSTGPANFFPTYTWNNVNIEGDINNSIQDDAQSFFNILTAAISDTSQFNNVTFWNRQDLGTGSERGGCWQTTSNAVYNNILFGPFGTAFNGVNSSRMIARYANNGRDDLTPTNHSGLVTNLDFRSLDQVSASTAAQANQRNWFIDVDASANVYFVNWLPGRPTDSASYNLSTIFNINESNVTVAATTRTATEGQIRFTTDALANIVNNEFGSLTGVRRVEFAVGANSSLISLNSTSDISVAIDGTTTSQVNFTLQGNTDLGTLAGQGVNVVRLYNQTVGGALLRTIALNRAGAQARVCVATNQQPNTAALPNDAQHIYTFSQTTLEAGIFDLIPQWLTNTPPIPIANRYHQHNVDRRLMFTSQYHNQLGNSSSDGASNPLTYATPIAALVSPTYRKYSWHQQPDNTTWGRLITVAVPPENASDTEVQTARDGGFDLYTGSEFTTETSIADPVDMLVEAANFNTAQAALDHYVTLGTRTGSDLHIGSKALSYIGLDDDGTIAADNTRVELLHDFTGSRIDFPGSLSFTGVNAAPMTSSILTTTGTTTFGIGTTGLLPDTFVTGVRANDGMAFSGMALTAPNEAEQVFQYSALHFNFADTARLGNFTVTNTATSNTLRGVPSSVPAEMVMTGTITHNDPNPRTINFEPGANVSGIRLEAPGTGELRITGVASAASFANVGTNVRILGSVAVTFPRAGRIMVGRERGGPGGTYTTMLSAPLDDNIITVTDGFTANLSGGDFNADDNVVIFYRPNDGSPTDNTERYRFSRTEFLFGASATQTVTAERIVEPLLIGVAGTFTPASGGFAIGEITGTLPNQTVTVRVDIGADLNLPNTKEFFLWMTSQTAFIEFAARNNAPNNIVSIGARGTSVDASLVTLARRGGRQNSFEGIIVTSERYGTTPPSGAAVDDPSVVIVSQPNYTANDRHLIPTNSQGDRDFIVNVVPDGITIDEVAAGVANTPAFSSILTQVQAMRTNRLLGIRPQTPTSGGDFNV